MRNWCSVQIEKRRGGFYIRPLCVIYDSAHKQTDLFGDYSNKTGLFLFDIG